MIVKRYWIKYPKYGIGHTIYEGYFLFGFIPLYIKQVLEP